MKSKYNTSRSSLTGHLRTLSRLALPILCLSADSTHAVTYFGSLSNFDVVNNSTEPCNGFEIELDGLTSKEITYTFIYQSYGTPRLVDSLDANGKPVIKVRYESKYNPVTHAFLNATPVAPVPTMTTAGHQCTSMPNAQNTSGCEHYGLGIIGNPTKTIYRWLVADPVTSGNLTYQLDPATGQPDTVSIPAPVFVVNAQPAQIPQPPAPVAGLLPVAPVAVPPQPVIQVEIEVPEAPEPANYQYGKAMWVKVFTTESPSPRDLKELVTDNAKVPNDPSEVEVEWQLLQKTIDPKKLAGGRDKLEANLAGQPMAQGNESVTRRYEFYEYVGEFDPENNEVLPVSDSNPVPGDIGNYIGAQMVAMNVFDADSDTKDDVMDNCLSKPNTDQRDTDGDGFGNVCDPDLNNDFVVNNADLNLIKLQFLKKIPNPDSDLNGDGKVNFNDLAILKTFMGKAPGPQAAK